MEKAIFYNRAVIVFNTIICLLMYKGFLDLSGGNLDGMIFWLLAPFVFLAQLIISFVLENRKGNQFPEDYYVCGSLFLVFPIAILVKAFL